MDNYVGVDILRSGDLVVCSEFYGIYNKEKIIMFPEVFYTEEERDIKLKLLNAIGDVVSEQ